MPDIAYGDAKWVPIRPGTDASFVLAMMNVMLQEGLADLKFLAKHTNAAYLIKADGRPLTEADMKAGGRKDRYAVHDLKTNRIVFQGVVLDEKGAAVGFDESADTDANLHFAQEVRPPRRSRASRPTNSSGSPTTSPTSRASLTTAGIPPRTATTSSSISSSTSSTPSMATSTAKAASS